MALDAKRRSLLTAEQFAVPDKRKLPIENAKHIRMAWDMLARTTGISGAERTEAKKRILARARAMHIDTSDWKD